jgi:DALR anticodon binding domain
VSSSFSPILSLAFRSLLVNRLQKATQLRIKSLNSSKKREFVTLECYPSLLEPRLLEPQSPTLIEVPLNRVKGSTPIHYTSAIALKLSRRESPLDSAEAIACHLRQMREIDSAKTGLEGRIWQNFTVQTAPSGQISLQLTQQGTAEWLQAFVSHSLLLNRPQPFTQSFVNAADTRNSTSTLSVLHTHARCCSLLRSANTEEMIRLTPADVEKADANWRIVAPQPIPWLTNGKFQCQHPAELQLIGRIVDVLDELSKPGDRPICKLAQALSQDFAAFHAACRIWGEVKSTHLPVSQVRLGLVLITQKILGMLLQQMEIEAPTAL